MKREKHWHFFSERNMRFCSESKRECTTKLLIKTKLLQRLSRVMPFYALEEFCRNLTGKTSWLYFSGFNYRGYLEPVKNLQRSNNNLQCFLLCQDVAKPFKHRLKLRTASRIVWIFFAVWRQSPCGDRGTEGRVRPVPTASHIYSPPAHGLFSAPVRAKTGKTPHWKFEDMSEKWKWRKSKYNEKRFQNKMRRVLQRKNGMPESASNERKSTETRIWPGREMRVSVQSCRLGMVTALIPAGRRGEQREETAKRERSSLFSAVSVDIFKPCNFLSE